MSPWATDGTRQRGGGWPSDDDMVTDPLKVARLSAKGGPAAGQRWDRLWAFPPSRRQTIKIRQGILLGEQVPARWIAYAVQASQKALLFTPL